MLFATGGIPRWKLQCKLWPRCRSQPDIVFLEFLRHHLPSLPKEILVIVAVHVLHSFRQAVGSKITPELCNVINCPVLPLPTVALIKQLLEVDTRGFVTNGDIDLALRHGEVGNLVVLALAVTNSA